MESQDLSLLDICPAGATFLFAFFPLEVSETTIPLDYSVLPNNLCIALPPQMRLLDCDLLPIQSPLYPSRPSNMLNWLHTSVSYGRILSMPKRKVQCSMAPSFGRLGMATNTPSSVYKPLHEYRILRVSNSPHLYELCTTLSYVEGAAVSTMSLFTQASDIRIEMDGESSWVKWVTSSSLKKICSSPFVLERFLPVVRAYALTSRGAFSLQGGSLGDNVYLFLFWSSGVGGP
ncbi:hypothetical protein BHE74_00007741 [Ensete ventricosum]|nr:hypothetical protein BHE74_00007741 [Ensete ventricosum]